MKTAYFREGQHYSLKNLSDKFSLDLAKTKRNIATLKKYSILKTVRNVKPDFSDLSDQDIVIGEIPDDSSDFTYQFTYVGIILLDDVLILCYPKYIDLDENCKDQIFDKFKTIIKVLQKYNQKEQLVQLYNGEEESKQFNKLAISLHILMDYFENGLYSNQTEIIELNGEGEILWDKTINETFAYIKKNTPYYLNVYTQDNTENDFDYIRRLHAAIVSQASRDLNKEKLLELFSLSPAELTEESLDDFGDTDYIKYRLEQELKNQFVTKKQSLLKTLYTYISETKSNQYDSSFSLYGTNSFNLVWENACATLFDDAIKSHCKVSDFSKAGLLALDASNIDYKNRSISDFIEKPEWIIDGKSLSYKGDLIPDIVSLQKTGEGNTGLYILDGKYYILQTEGKNLIGNPGIQDVVKQYIYNASLRNFINTFKIAEVANVFLIPSLIKNDENDKDKVNENRDIENVGQVPYWTVQKSSFKEIPDVQIVRIRPEYVWDLYLKNQKLPQEFWKKIKTSPTENYLYHNDGDQSILLPNDKRKHILVGFLRNDYFQHIVTNFESSSDKENSFIFYFYATDSKMRYPLHPYIDFCTDFIGYSADKNQFIQGELEVLSNGRCKIDEISAEQLNNELKGNSGFIKNTNNALTYYKMKVNNIRKVKSPYNGIQDYPALQQMVKVNGLNEVLFKYSPKVIDV